MEKKKVVKEFASAISTLNLESELNLPAKTIAEYLFKQLDILKWSQQHLYKADISAMEICSAPREMSLPLETTIVDDVNDFVDKMYSIYPATCPKRNASTGKSRKDKDRIKRLLKVYTKEQIEQVIRAEVEEKYGKQYMQNFSTFLNSIPFRSDDLLESGKVAVKKDENEGFCLNGIFYK